MLVWFLVFCLSVLIPPGECCLSKEYELRDGSVVKRDCTAQSGTRCVACVNGTYMNQPNGLTRCFPCSSCDQGRGLFAQQGCTLTRDTICEVITGYFCEDLLDDKGCSLAHRHSRCIPGERIKERGTRRTDTTCEPCPAGSFSVEGLNCTLWTTCSETQEKVEEGSPTSDAICGAASKSIPLVLVILLLVVVIILLIVLVLLWIRKGNRLKNQQQITTRPLSSEPCGEEEAVGLTLGSSPDGGAGTQEVRANGADRISDMATMDTEDVFGR
ncbi:tumor necrosis factor receptor superfamily member 14-like isoform 3-T3 [Spinachia spinachia]